MPISVFKIFAVVDGALFPEEDASRRQTILLREAYGVLTNFGARGDGPAWSMIITLDEPRDTALELLFEKNGSPKSA